MAKEVNIVYKAINELREYENNPRDNAAAVPYVKNSIKEFGFKVPIVIDTDNVIIAGHTRLAAAKELGMQEVPCIVADDLTEEQVKAFRLVDNKVHEASKWDIGKLAEELDGIMNIEMEDFGFADIAVPAINLDDTPAEKEGHEARTVCCPKCGFEFQA